MLVVEMGTVVALKVLVLSLGDKTLYLKLYVTSLITLGIDGFQGGIGDESLVVLTLLVILHYTYHLEHQVTHLYVAPDEREIVFGEFLGLCLPQGNHLAAFFHVYVVDEAS